MTHSEIQLSTGPLESLIQNTEDIQSAYLKVGILGDYAGRTPDENGTEREDSDLTNPQLGFWHEFGIVKTGLPERSFLRMPILLKLPDALTKMGSAEEWRSLIIDRGIVELLDVIGNKCIEIIAWAFHTGGFGTWAKLRPRTIMRKKNSDILIESGQMQRSITYAVVRKSAPTTPIAPVI